MKCEKAGCRAVTQGYELFDYCTKCGRNLCADHMATGCCGSVPALSGMAESDESPEPARKKEGE